MLRSRSCLPLAVLFAGFFLYLFSSAPALAPYRDMGEMVSVSKTLGVAHPPGYPAYALLGKIASLVPLANSSYRVNLASVAGGALSAALLFLVLIRLDVQPLLSLAAALFWLTSAGVWTVSTVTEMYSLNLAAVAAVLLAWTLAAGKNELRALCLCALLVGAGVGIRLDLILIAPGLAAAAVYRYAARRETAKIPGLLFYCALFFAAGFSIYLYLLIRSNQQPLLNWYRPETFERLWSSLARKSHGGTLDLLSASYNPGELFWTDFKLYLLDFCRQFRWIGVGLAALGMVHLFRTRRETFVLTAVAWFFCAPFFLYKANLPPNPHAYAILEPHFLMPNVFALVWIGAGLQWLWDAAQTRVAQTAMLGLLAFALPAHAAARWAESSRRDQYFGVDYGNNALATLPKDSALLIQKDVQLFTFWALQYAEGKRRDVAVVARGLAGSPWYIQMQKDAGLPAKLGPVRSAEEIERFLRENPGRGVYFGSDQDVPPSPAYVQRQTGLVREARLASAADGASIPAVDPFLNGLYAYRGRYVASRQKDFFSSDLIEDHSKSHFARAVEFSKADPKDPRALAEWNRALVLNPENGAIYYRRGFAYFMAGDLEKAARDFRSSERLYEKTAGKTLEYRSLPDVVNAVRGEWLESLVNLGVVYEKMGKLEDSEAAYLKCLKVNPGFARAHYNIAVLYWNRDWRKVVHHLRETLRLDPNHAEARNFLPKAIYAAERSGAQGL